MKEQTKEWKPVVGYEGLYEVSSDGDVRNAKTGMYISQANHTKGYLAVCLHNNGKRKYCTVHRLVAKAFIDNPMSKREVNHRNGIKTDNRTCNLEWNTSSENNTHAIKTGLRPNKGKEVIDMYTGIFYNSLKDACIATSYSYGNAIVQIHYKYKTQRFQYI